MVIKTEELTLEERLAAIQQAVEQAKGDPKKETQLLQDIVDPQDALNCEGCQ